MALTCAVTATAGDDLPDSLFNALDYVLQSPAPRRQFVHKRFADHFFITAGGAGTFLRGNDALYRPITRPGIETEMTVGDWFTPVHGARLSVTAGQHRTSDGRNPYYMGVAADYLMNLSSLLRNDNPDRRFEIIGALGVGYERVWLPGIHKNAGSLRLGLQLRYNASPSTFLFMEPRATVYTDGVDMMNSWHRYDLQASLTLGVGYRVSWAKSHDRYRYTFTSEENADNLFYGIMAGPTSLIHHNVKSELTHGLSGQAALFAGKWFTAASGLRLTTTLGAANESGNRKPHFASAELDYMINLNSALNGYRPEARFESNLAIGPAIIYSHRGGHTYHGGLGMGWQLLYNTDHGLGFFIEPHLIMTKSNLWTGNVYGAAPFNLLGSINIGLQYRIDGYNRVHSHRFGIDERYRDFLASRRSFVSAAAGISTFRSTFAKSVNTYADVGQWFTESSAWRVGLDYHYNHTQPRMMSWGVDADYMVSLSTLSAGFNPHRLFDLSFVAGMQVGDSHHSSANHFFYGFKGALNGRFNVSDNIDLFIEPAFLAQHLGNFRKREFTPQFRVLAGISYKMGGEAHSRRSHSDSRPRNFVSLTGGAGLFSETFFHTTVRTIPTIGQVAVGRWFSNSSAVQLGYDFIHIPYKPWTNNVPPTSCNVSMIHADYMLNLVNLLWGDNDHSFAIAPRAGLGVAWSNYNHTSPSLAATGGIRFGWNLPSNFGIYLEPQIMLCKREIGPYRFNSHKFMGVGSGVVGLSWNF